jgi:S-adenosylmethionine:tRNA ribosyltransferase-isomerase
MDISLFDYSLPEDRIAQYPLDKRDESRMMVLLPKEGKISHCMFSDFSSYLNEGDVLVVNRTKVIRARLLGKKEGTGANVEVLLLKEIEQNLWECLVRPGSKLRAGARIIFSNNIECELISRTEYGGRIARFKVEDNLLKLLNDIAHVPLPPYIKRADEKNFDSERYQTVYAQENGSIAAPTAGLHFTQEILGALEKKGIGITPLILHIGLGTFQPVKTETVEEHKMHSEFYTVPLETAELVNNARVKGRRVLVVGTTSVRALESCANEDGTISAGSGETALFIYPGYKFRSVNSLLTNFHLPRSTLLIMVSALAGREFIQKAYNEAVRKEYRFYSYGDCMLILNE